MDKEGIKERLGIAYNYLYETGKIHSVTDLAEKMKRSRPSVSRALGGVPEYMNEKFLRAFTSTFYSISYNWLLSGDGEMLENEKQPTEQLDVSAMSNMIGLYAQMIRRADDLRVELQKEIEEVRSLKDELKAVVLSLNSRANIGLAAEDINPK